MRIQFDIDAETWGRAEEFILNKKYLSHYGEKAFLEWLNRKEAAANKRLSRDQSYIKKILIELGIDVK